MEKFLLLIKKHWQILAILFLASFLIFFRISHTDIIGDDGHYSFRAIGMVDFLMSDPQSTPIQWFDHVPWWSYLSFHDHPIFLFIIQNLFLRIATTVFFAKLPYALFALGSIFLTYLWVKKMYSERLALASALLMALSSDFIALARRPLMETGVIFFILLAIYYFTIFLHDRRVWWKLGIVLGLLMEIKFTALFIFPAFLSIILLNPILRKDKETRRRLWHMAFIIFVLALPVIIYNFMMYYERGHFSYQFARLFHQKSPWKAGGANVLNPIGHVISLAKEWAHWFSIPYFIVALCSIIFDFFKKQKKMRFLIITMAWFFLEDALIGGKDMYVIFLPIIMAQAFLTVHDQIKKTTSKNILKIGAGIFCAYLLFYGINSNLLPVSFGPVGWLRASNQPNNYGLAQLESYLSELVPKAQKNGDLDTIDVFPDIKAKVPLLSPYRIPAQTLANNTINNIILYDNNINWFARFWIFGRRLFYENSMFISTKTLPELVKNLGDTPRTSYFIKATENTLLDSDRYQTDLGGDIEREMISRGEAPVKIIYRDDGKEAFRIYKVKEEIKLDIE